MECNKEEAIRAKEIAETKMQNKDFAGAHRIALRAQQLFPNLDNILQMLAVCDVHCASENKFLGNEIDWYKILQVEQTSDEALIKKQYKKLAFQLHPDKNKFSGAEAAFKLIGEAQRMLLDRGKRSLHDMKRRASFGPTAPSRTSQEASKDSNVGKQTTVQNTFRSSPSSPYVNMNSQGPRPHQQTQSGCSNDHATFWTSCPFCGVKYNFYLRTLKKSLVCLTCKKPFIAHDINVQGMQPETKGSRHVFPKKEEFPNQGACKVGTQSTFENTTSNVEFHCNLDGDHSMEVDKDARSGEFRPSRKQSGKRRRKQVEESSESSDTGSSTDTEDILNADGNFQARQNFGFYGEENPQKSACSKQKVSYNENLSGNDDFANPRKNAKRSETSCAIDVENEDESLKGEASEMNKQAGVAADARECEKEMKQKGCASADKNPLNGKKETKKMREDEHKKRFVVDDHSSASSSSKATRDPETYDCPDPDFSDFDNNRKEDCFKIGQMWAIYDTVDAMPRFYARITRVFSPGFKVRITWLEPDPDDEDQIKWVNEELPVSCGKFKSGDSQNTEDIDMFSHIIEPEKGKCRGSCKIYPRKGETWAIFKNWDIQWTSHSENNSKFEFEFVEVLSEYDEDYGISVAYLGKVKNFASLFCRVVKDGVESFQILQNELLRFSHRVPSFQMSGEERKDVPKGSFELDPASLPANLEAVVVPEDLKVEAGEAHLNGCCAIPPEDKVEPTTGSDGSASMYQTDEMEVHYDTVNDNSDNVIKDGADHLASNPDVIELPEPQFYNFDAEKSTEKLQVGQIWALYSDYDGLPKYYGKIKKIDSCPKLKLRITWLLPCKQQDKMLWWVDKKMPICCGRFKTSKAKARTYYDTAAFSHRLRAELAADRKNEFAIYPRKGEVWALYKNWTIDIKCSELEDCDYDIVEVVEENDLQVKVLVLEFVVGFNSVFKGQVKGGSAVYMDIPRAEMLRFSHQIPAFRLKEERSGSLRGFWELDPASVPVLLFCLN